MVMAEMSREEADAHWAKHFHDKAKQLEAENERLREQLRIATEQLQAFSDQGQERYPGEMGTFAHDALIQMSVVE